MLLLCNKWEWWWLGVDVVDVVEDEPSGGVKEHGGAIAGE
jgi:hypothetical protein